MSDIPKPRRNENQSTFFLNNKQSGDEAVRSQNESQMITCAMGGPLAEQADTAIFRRVLNIACGSGDWIIKAAQLYPQMTLVGIDINPRIIDYARENAATAGVADRVQFHVMDALRPLELPTDSFDLINLRLGVTFIRSWEWLELIAEMLRVAHPAGVIRLTEPQIKHENKGPTPNPGHLKLHDSLICALYRSGHLFQQDTTGITAHLAPLLTRYGCKDVQMKAYSLEFRSGTPEWQAYYTNATRIMLGQRSFFAKWGCFNGDYDLLSRQVTEEMLKPDYRSVWNFLTIWGKTPL